MESQTCACLKCASQAIARPFRTCFLGLLSCVVLGIIFVLWSTSWRRFLTAFERIDANDVIKMKSEIQPSVLVNDQAQTYDNWPVFSRKYYSHPIPKSPFYPNFTITFDYNTTEFLQRPGVQGQSPKIITWMVPTRYLPPLPEPVRLRFCPELPCLMTTNRTYQQQSVALVWNGQIMEEAAPPARAHPDQVFVFHNDEPQKLDWIYKASFRKPAWKSVFNWTFHYRIDSDFITRYGYIVKRKQRPERNYTDILAKKTKFAAWIVSHSNSQGRRDDYVKILQQYIPVDKYGDGSPLSCPRSKDNACLEMISTKYKFYLSFENAFCQDYISEKFFRYFGADVILVVRGSNDYRYHSPPGLYINTADFKTIKQLADHLHYLDTHPEVYINILKAKDNYESLFEDYPIRDKNGQISFMEYHYEAVPFCEMCLSLWDLDNHRKMIPDIAEWFDRGNCYNKNDINR